jgi:hypothetical protein
LAIENPKRASFPHFQSKNEEHYLHIFPFLVLSLSDAARLHRNMSLQESVLLLFLVVFFISESSQKYAIVDNKILNEDS